MCALALALALQQDLVERFFEEKDRDKRRDIASRLKDVPPDKLDAMIREAPRGAAAGAGTVVKRESKADFGGEAFRYLVWVPEGYDPAKRCRAIVSLHGLGGAPEQQIDAWRAQAREEKDLFVIAPEVKKHTWGGPRQGHSVALTALRECLRDFRIDPDRVFLDGISMGGVGTFSIAMYHPDRWAGIAPRARGPRTEYTEDAQKKRTHRAKLADNYRSLPIYWIYGEKDPLVPLEIMLDVRRQFEEMKLNVVYAQHPGGHEWVPEETPRVAAWMRKLARDPYAAEVTFATLEKNFLRAHWIEIEKAAEGRTIVHEHMGQNNEVCETRAEWTRPARVLAKREKNRIELRTERARSLIVHLHERMVDFAQPVQIVVNGTEVWNRKVEPSRLKMLESALERDRGMFYSAEVTVKVP
jgi:pimeloyl-ACP methyl ester carboxylesterase